MRALVISLLLTVALAGCSADRSAPPPATTEAPAPAEPPPATEPAPEAPPPDAAPGTGDDQARTEAPAEAGGEPEQPTLAPPPPPPPRDVASPAPAPKSAPVTRSLTRATPVIVEIDRTQERRPANGGSSVVLFTKDAANAHRNLVTCTNIWGLMNTATTQEVRVGIRKASDGTVEALRPLYWLKAAGVPAAAESSTKDANLTKNPSVPNAAADCPSRMANYDFVRAKTIRDKYRLTGAGPYFVVARTDEQAAAIIDLSGRSDAEVADLVRYFRDGFAFQNDIWDPARNAPATKKALLSAFFGTRFRDSLVNALGFVASPAARAGCRLGDLRDTPCT